jgi:adenosylcobinamide-GDP ribazoletransferase
MRGLAIAISFLTRIPVPSRVHSEEDVARGVPWFPVVGAVVGLLVALVYGAALHAFPPFVAAVLAITGGVLLTGAFHEDGLADTFDAFGGGWTQQERMRIFKDPTHGTYGVMALVLSSLLRAGAVSAFDLSGALLALPAAHALSRAAAVVLLRAVAPAGEGLGASYGTAVTTRRAIVGATLGLLIALACLGVWLVPAAVIVGLTTFAIGRISAAKIGGVTGDVLGAAQQVAEIGVLLVALVGLT